MFSWYNKSLFGNVFFIGVLLIYGIADFSYAQSTILEAVQQQDSDGRWVVKLLNKPDRPLRFDYSPDLSGTNTSLKVGTISNSYGTQSFEVSGNSQEIVPNQENLPPGRYYARITNASATEFSEIESKAQQNDNIFYSNEVEFIIEAQRAPEVIAPRGKIDSPTPSFNWNAVPGVKAYWVIVSSTPFDIVTGEDDGISIEGANIVWQFITSETTAQYGDINPNTPYQTDAPPLDPNREYSYAILNLYEKDNPVYASPVFGGVIPVTYVDENPIPKPQLITPADSAVFDGAETITLQWSEVEEAVSYTVNLKETITQQGVDASVNIWSVTTTNVLVDYPALGNLKNTEYRWNVVANNPSGGGTSSGTATSPTESFIYQIPLGQFRLSARSTLDNSNLVGVEVTVRAISGGVTPNLPALLQSATFSDSVVAGRYEFTAKKQGYKSTVIEAEVREDQTTNVRFDMEPLPASISGTVEGEEGNPVQNAQITLENNRTGKTHTTTSEGNGKFVLAAPTGNYSFSVNKNGYTQVERSNLSLGVDQQFTFNSPLELVNDEATISGYVLNERGNPIQLAEVTLSNEETDGTQQVRTNGDGFYQVIVSSGSWVISAEKSGFVLSGPLRIDASVGENLQNQNLAMTGKANQISGFVREVIVNEDGGVGSAPLEDVQIRAVPSHGPVITTQTSRNGAYSLNLKRGSYTISAKYENYSSSEPLEVTLGYAETLNGVNFDLTPNPSTVTGRVVSVGGSGLVDVTVQVTGSASAQTTTTAAGYYSMTLPVGSHTIQAQRLGYSSQGYQQVNLNAGQELSGVNFRMSPNAVVITGTVRSSSGTLPYSTVFAESPDGTVAERQANKFGEYEFSLSSGEWTVYAKKDGFTYSDSTTVQLDPGQSRTGLKFVLSSIQRDIAGTVTGSNSALRDARVQLLDLNSGNELKSTYTKVDGSFKMTAETGRSYQLVIDKEGYQGERRSIDPLQNVSEQYSLDVTLRASQSQISGTITSTDDIPLGKANISVFDGDNLITEALTSTTGDYSLGVVAGSYQVQINKPGYQTKSFNISLGIGETRDNLDAKLKKDFAIYSGTVVDQDGNEVNGVLVRLTDGPAGATDRSASDGSYALTQVVSGTYMLTANKEGYEQYEERNITIANGANISDQITLNKYDALISGTAEDQNGQPLESTNVYAVHTDGTEFSTVSNSSGIFEFSALPPGEYSVYGQKTGYHTAENITITLASALASSTGHTITLDAKNGEISGTVADASTGTDIGSAKILAIGPGSDQTLSGNSGAYSISALSTGNYQVIATKQGYATDTMQVSLTPGEGLSKTIDFTLRKNIGSISGRVLNQSDNSLGQNIIVRAVAVNASESYETSTNLDGTFSFNSIANGHTYIIEPQALGEGLVNTSTEVRFSKGQNQLTLSEHVTVVKNTGIIRGNAEISNANVELLDSEGSTVSLKRTQQDGLFLFRYLSEGSYTVRIYAEGYTFEPASISVELSADQETNLNDFSATENIGTLKIEATDSEQAPLSDVSVTLLSSDEEIKRTGSTNAEGVVSFDALTDSKAYTLFAQKSGFSLVTDLQDSYQVEGEQARTETLSFQRNEFNLSGIVARSDTKAGLNGLDVSLSATDGSLSRSVVTGDDGEYYFSELPNKEYRVEVAPNSFQSGGITFDMDTLDREPRTVDGSQQRVSIADSLQLWPAYINVIGKVSYNNSGVPDAQVEIEGTAQRNTQTNQNGIFRFNRYPVSFQNQDSISLSANVQYEGYEQTNVLTISGNRVGKNVRLDDYVIPSGQLDITIISGSRVLSGLNVIVNDPNTENPREFITNQEGRITTSQTLRAGLYTVNVNTSDYVLPTEPFELELADKTTIVKDTLRLPYQFSSPDSIQAAYPSTVTVQAPAGSTPNAEASFYYKRKSQNSFTEQTLSPTTGAFKGELPALNTLETIEFYVEIKDQQSGMLYRSSIFTEEPGAEDLLDQILLNPRVSELTLRTNDEYVATISVKDGNNNVMRQAFSGSSEGTGSLTVPGGSVDEGIDVSREGNQLTITTPSEPGRYSFQVNAEFNNQQISQPFYVHAQQVEIGDIKIPSLGNNTISNSQPFTFNYTAVDTSGSRIHLGNSLSWRVSPSHVGSINENGVFTPAENTIGEFNVHVTDQNSDSSATSETITMVAEILPDQSMDLNYGEEFSMQFDQNSFDARTTLRMSRDVPESVKKYTSALGSDSTLASYTSSDEIYSVSASGGSLVKQATVSLEEGSSLRLFEGKRAIAHFNREKLQWELLESGASKAKGKNNSGDTISGQTGSLGQFVILAENQSLGLRHFAVLPTPFSPQVAPAKIGYLLTTQNPPAYVTIQIYNMRGQLVRTLLDRDSQMPGRYGSESGRKVIEWDGKTDQGRMARNGRYVIRILLEDGQGKKEYVKSLVLIK